ncbi:MAG: ABC transporter permease [Eubacteriales bacterium]|nr:ABC transporter permease [Eubacteriales bacterium]
MSAKQLGKRLLQILIVLVGISFFTFILTYLAPGDPVKVMFQATGTIPSQELLDATRERMGLNDPMLVQYGRWVMGCLHGDFGMSYSTGRSVVSLLVSRLVPTLKLSLLSMVFMLIVAVPFGMLAAVYKNKPIDYIVRACTFFGVSMPNFWVGTLLLLFFALKLGIFPVVSSMSSGFKSIFLPAVTLAFAMSAKYTRQVRTAVLEELNQDYVIGARARGIKESVILWKHVFPNSLLPLITMFGLSMGSLLGGTAVVEVIFTYHGLGNLAISAIMNYDYPLIQGYVLWIALIYMVVNLLVDISYNFVDPRIREKR